MTAEFRRTADNRARDFGRLGMARGLLNRGATMIAMTKQADVATIDERVYMRVDWAGYEALDGARGERANPRITYLDGVAELMSPGKDHERINYRIGRLVEAFCTARGITIEGYGCWTIKNRQANAAAEPDCCYVFSTDRSVTRPDLVIEVVWTSGGLDKLEVWRRLGVSEVWFWMDDELTIHVLGPGGYKAQPRSARLPDLDIAVLYELLEASSTQEAVARMAMYAGSLTPASD
jgi:Uma2 family endonuclease